MIRPAIIGAYQYPATRPRDVLHRCRPSCCATPYMCARRRECACHDGEVRD